MEKIPIIDFSKATNQSLENICQEDLKKFGDEIVKDFENFGFAYIKNHGISQEIDNIFKMMEAFFNLPLEVKKNYEKKTYTEDGYMELSREILDKPNHDKELRENFDVLRDATKGFPNEIEGFERNILQMIEKGSEFFNKFLRCLEVGLDLPFGSLLNIHTNLVSKTNPSVLRLLHYPPITFDITQKFIRCGEHTDYGTVTILFQDTIGGLEVKNRDNEWKKTDPVHGTILLIVGDMFQKLTSGRLKATPHRVIVPNEERRKKCSRKSVAFFLVPNKDLILKPFDAPDTDGNSYETSYEYLVSKYENSGLY